MAVGLLIMGGTLLLAWDYLASRSAEDGKIVRNAYGSGEKTEQVMVQKEGGKQRIPVKIQIAEQQYSKAEVKEMFERVIRRMDTLILGENKSFDRVERNLNLLAKVPDEPVEVTWELDRYDVMNIKGEIQKQKLRETGTVVNISAVLTYTEDETKQARYQCAVCVYPQKLTKEEMENQSIVREIQRKEKEEREHPFFYLPEKVGDQTLTYYRKMPDRGLVLIIMGVLVGILLKALDKQNQEKKMAERKNQMILDYPDIVNKLTLYMGAGMTVKRAWKKIAEDYKRQRDITGFRYAYEEMCSSCHEMDSGVAESSCYENYGRRCDVQAYVRLGALLSQNLRKGTKGLTQLLKAEALQAFEDRKANARKRGEEAGTKLLLPMFLMLSVVLVIVIVPAFLSMQM